jgi:diguanylate cyclase (GGDEF)-like protein
MDGFPTTSSRVSDPPAIVTTTDGTIVEWTGAATDVYGFGASEVVGLPVSLVVPELRGDVFPRIVAATGAGRRFPLIARDATGHTSTLLFEIRDDRRTGGNEIDAVTTAVLGSIDGAAGLVSHDGRVLAGNEAWALAERTGWPVPSGATVGRSYTGLLTRAAATAAANVELAAGIHGVLAGELELFCLEYQSRHDHQRWCRLHLSAIEGLGALVRHADATSARHLALSARNPDDLDPLTSLSTHRRFTHEATGLWASTPTVGIVAIGLDDFDAVNARLGHDGGDVLLRSVAERLRSGLHHDDLLARIHGDRFAVACPTLLPGDGPALGAAIAATLKAPFSVGHRLVAVTASVGVREADTSRTGPNAALQDAESAVHEAKSAGRGQIRVYDDAIAAAVARRSRLERALLQSSNGDGFWLEYQPQVDLTVGKVVGFEALLRWRHQGEPISPVEFVPLAEHTGAIFGIGAWVMAEACRQLGEWQANGCPADLTVTVNVSPRQLVDPGLRDHLESCMHRNSLLPSTFGLELTESAIMEGGEASLRMLAGLRDLGVTVGIDDFGTGYSSLGQLRVLPLDVIKVDRSFVTPLGSDPAADAIVDAVLGLARSMDLKVVAEGVETAPQASVLQAMGCGLAQGWLFAPAVVPEAAPALWEAGFSAQVGATATDEDLLARSMSTEGMRHG